MKNILKIAILLQIIAQNTLLAQSDTTNLPKAKTFEIIAQQASRGNDVLHNLQTYDGSTVGKINNEVSDTTFHYRVEVAGKPPLRMEALSNVMYSPNADKFWMFGNSPFLHSESEVELKLYDGNGILQKDLGFVAFFPFMTTMDSEGNFYVAGKAEFDKVVFACKKFDKNGNLLWQKIMPWGHPNAITISESGDRIGVAISDEKTLRTTIFCLNAEGNTLGQNSDFAMIDRLAFAGDERLVVSTGRRIYLYKNNGKEAYAAAQLPGYAIGQHPVSASPDGQHILVVSTDSPEVSTGFRVMAFDQNAVLTHELRIDGEASDDGGRLIKFENNESLQLSLPNAIFTLKMEN